MLYDKLMDLALEFGDAIVREAMLAPLGQIGGLTIAARGRDGLPLSTETTVSRRWTSYDDLVQPVVEAIGKAKVKVKHASVARPAKKIVAVPKPAPTVPETKSISAKQTPDDAVLKHLPKDKLVRSDKLKTRSGLMTKTFTRRVEDLVRRGVVIRSTQGTHRYYALS